MCLRNGLQTLSAPHLMQWAAPGFRFRYNSRQMDTHQRTCVIPSGAQPLYGLDGSPCRAGLRDLL
jgi:hypothetical protein